MGTEFDAALTQARMELHIRRRVEAKTLTGAVTGVWIGGKKRCGTVIGWSDPDRGLKLREDSIFRLASMTKPITGTAVMLQWEKGLIDLDEPVTKWLPGFRHLLVADRLGDGEILSTVPAERPVTPRMLLTHSSGIGSGVTAGLQPDLTTPAGCGSLGEALTRYAKAVLEFQPGTSQAYSGILGMDLLARIVEITADMPYEEFLRENLLRPLGMFDTGYTLTREQIGRVVAMYTADGSFTAEPMRPDCGFADFPGGYPGGGGGLLSTLEDYGSFAAMLAGGGALDGVRILKEGTVNLMASPQLSPSFPGIGDHFNWGLSMRVCPVQCAPEQPLTGGSFGWSGAYNTHFWVDRKKDLYAVFMANIRNGAGAGAETAFEFERDVMAGFDECP